MSEEMVAVYDDTKPIEDPEPQPEEEAVEEKPPEPEVEPEPELSEQEKEELKASKDGWAPEDQWKGDPKEWVDAKTFNIRGPLFDKIKQQNSKIDNLNNQLDTMASLMKRIREDERKKTLAELEKKKVEQMDGGDFAGVVQTDNEIEKVKSEKDEPEETVTPQQRYTQEQSEKFLQDNNWYTSNKRMQLYADAAGREYAANNPNPDINKLLDYMVEETKNMFPDHFGEKPKAPPRSPVNDTNTASTPQKKKDRIPTKSDLDEVHRDILKRFVEQDDEAITPQEIAKLEAEIIKEWKDTGEI